MTKTEAMIAAFKGTYKCSKSGVEYVQSDSGFAVHIKRDGTPIICEP